MFKSNLARKLASALVFKSVYGKKSGAVEVVKTETANTKEFLRRAARQTANAVIQGSARQTTYADVEARVFATMQPTAAEINDDLKRFGVTEDTYRLLKLLNLKTYPGAYHMRLRKSRAQKMVLAISEGQHESRNLRIVYSGKLMLLGFYYRGTLIAKYDMRKGLFSHVDTWKYEDTVSTKHQRKMLKEAAAEFEQVVGRL